MKFYRILTLNIEVDADELYAFQRHCLFYEVISELMFLINLGKIMVLFNQQLGYSFYSIYPS